MEKAAPQDTTLQFDTIGSGAEAGNCNAMVALELALRNTVNGQHNGAEQRNTQDNTHGTNLEERE